MGKSCSARIIDIFLHIFRDAEIPVILSERGAGYGRNRTSARTEYAFFLGGGVIAFGVWSVVKMIMYFAVDPLKYFRFDDIPQEIWLYVMVFVYGVIVLLAGLDVGLRIYIGLSARAEARGKKKSRVYIIVAALMAAGNLLLFLGTLVTLAFDPETATDNILDTLVSAIVDITAQITLIELVFTARNVQRLRKLLSL